MSMNGVREDNNQARQAISSRNLFKATFHSKAGFKVTGESDLVQPKVIHLLVR